MKNKKQIKSIQQTTFTNSNMKDQFQANSNSQNQPQIVLKMTRVSYQFSTILFHTHDYSYNRNYFRGQQITLWMNCVGLKKI